MKNGKRIFIFSLLGVTAVAVYIFRYEIRQVLKKTFGGQKWFDESVRWYRDNQTKEIVDTLHPDFRDTIKEFFSAVEKKLGLQMFATSGYRTFEEQAKLHSQNSSNAKAGYSSHNYGFAVDVNVIDPKTSNIILRKSSTSKAWEDSGIIKISKQMGLKWGGGGAFGSYHDPIHFYIEPKGLKTMDLLAIRNKGKVDNEGYVIV